MAKSGKTSEKVRSSFQVAVLFEGTGLDGDSSSNVGCLARALAACLVEIGVAVVPSDAKRVFKAWRSDDKESELARFRQKGCLRPIDVRYIGAWDTVDATVGIDGADFIDVPRVVHAARYAVAINEYHGHFDYVPMCGRQVIERFFAGSPPMSAAATRITRSPTSPGRGLRAAHFGRGSG